MHCHVRLLLAVAKDPRIEDCHSLLLLQDLLHRYPVL